MGGGCSSRGSIREDTGGGDREEAATEAAPEEEPGAATGGIGECSTENLLVREHHRRNTGETAGREVEVHTKEGVPHGWRRALM